MNIVAGQGFPDFIMLTSDKVSMEGFMENLKLRFDQKQIYTYIGDQLVCMNPFTSVAHMYTDEVLESYRKKYLFEVQPHIYAVADDTYRMLIKNHKDQCVIVTGESGAGKTEAAKIFMSYISRVSSGGEKADKIKEALLQSNPVLEAFGNAKTVRNDNSSRFGKYMEIQFDAIARPIGGKISQYLLEKSRVITRAKDERSFHIFYQLLSAGPLLGKLHLEGDPSKYRYLSLSGCFKVDRMDDAKEFKDVTRAMSFLGFTDSETDAVWRLLACILHMGNIEFKEEKAAGNMPASSCVDTPALNHASELLGIDVKLLTTVLTSRKMTTGVNRSKAGQITIPLSVTAAKTSRDSWTKELYNKIFSWVTQTINKAIIIDGHPENMIGVLDIYGFEIFEENSFEQFCINFCNEKLQQLFIKLVLKAEQEEYVREGIEWTKIDYFNNQGIVNLVEGKTGIFKLLDEAGVVGDKTNESFLAKLDQNFPKHEHYESYQCFKKQRDKSLGTTHFRIHHYAGVVDYGIDGFIEKNIDTLFPDLIEASRTSNNSLVSSFYADHESEHDKSKKRNKSTRPMTSGTQFKINVNLLVEKLELCEPHYIRCIKSNDTKSGFKMDEERTIHQIRYLNLVETMRVRKAGFCHRQEFQHFYNRYHMVSASTWPTFDGDAKDGTKEILKACGVQVPVDAQFGLTKLFVREASSLVKFEEMRQEHMPKVCIAIQRRFHGYKARVSWARLLAAVKIQRMLRGAMARHHVRNIKAACAIQRKFRVWRACVKVEAMKLANAKAVSAICIQTRWRALMAKEFVTENKERLARERAERIRVLKVALALQAKAFFRGYQARQRFRRIEATIKIQRRYRYYLLCRFVRRCIAATSLRTTKANNFGKVIEWPSFAPAPASLAETDAIFKRMWHLHWGHQKIKSLKPQANVLMRQKVVTLGLFEGSNKKWDTARAFKASYMDDYPEALANYNIAAKALFADGGDIVVLFADDCVKVNRHFKAQHQVIVVTDAHVYKFKPGKIQMIKDAIPLSALQSIHMSQEKDTWVILKFCAPHRDMVLDLGSHSIERYSEFVTVCYTAAISLGSSPPPVNFERTITYNNSRDTKKDGVAVTLDFQHNPKPTPTGLSEFKKGKAQTSTVFFNK